MATHRNNVISTSIESVNSIFQVHNAALAYLANPVYIYWVHIYFCDSEQLSYLIHASVYGR